MENVRIVVLILDYNLMVYAGKIIVTLPLRHFCLMVFVRVVLITKLVLLMMERVAVVQRARKEREWICRVIVKSVKMEKLFPKMGNIVFLKDQLLATIDKN
jgi:hypothetical protein